MCSPSTLPQIVHTILNLFKIMSDPKNTTPEPAATKTFTEEQVKALMAAQEEQLARANEELAAAKSEKVVIVTKGIPVTIDKKRYLVVHGVIVNNIRKTAEQISEDKALCAKLIEQKSSAIQAV